MNIQADNVLAAAIYSASPKPDTRWGLLSAAEREPWLAAARNLPSFVGPGSLERVKPAAIGTYLKSLPVGAQLSDDGLPEARAFLNLATTVLSDVA